MKASGIRRRLWIAATILFVFYLANFVYSSLFSDSAGTFGDTFGAVNALFSGAALFFLVQAFLLQREELDLIREEREDTKKLLSAQEGLVQDQQKALNNQLFDQAFYSLLSLFNEELTRQRSNGELKNSAAACYDSISREREGSDHWRVRESRNPGSMMVDLGPNPEMAAMTKTLAYMALNLHAFVAKARLSEDAKAFYCGLLESLITDGAATCIVYNTFDMFVALKHHEDTEHENRKREIVDLWHDLNLHNRNPGDPKMYYSEMLKEMETELASRSVGNQVQPMS